MKWLRQLRDGALIRGESWSVSITNQELKLLLEQTQILQELLAKNQSYLMDEEDITLEAVTEELSLYLIGLPNAFSLTLTLYYGRKFEGEWPVSIALLVFEELCSFKYDIAILRKT